VPAVDRDGNAGAVVRNRAGDALLLRKEVADGLVELGPRLEHARPRDLQAEIVAVRALDEAVEDRILEQLPPVRLDRVQRFFGHTGARQPARRRIARRCLVVRADHAGGREQEKETGKMEARRPQISRPTLAWRRMGIAGYRDVGIPGQGWRK